GPDRVGDQHQLTRSLTSRFIGQDNGIEHLSLSGAQILYFSDREVQLPGEEPEILPRSDFAGEMKAAWGSWSGTASLLIDPETERTRERNFRIEYNEQPRRLFNLGYRERVADLEERTFSTRQATASSVWAWNNRWHSIVYAQYDIEKGFLRQGLFGFGYDSCCWSTRFVTRNYRQSINDEPDRGVFLELGLKGMTTLGGRLDDALQDAILGYQPRAQ
ncbi:MAG: LPS assembly protein LptD, partial [Thiohalospira sp.]